MKALILFMSVFFFMIICTIGVALCGGMDFGTAPFGWLMGCGVSFGIVAGAAMVDVSRFD